MTYDMSIFDKRATEPTEEPKDEKSKRGRHPKRSGYSNPVDAKARLEVAKAAGQGGDSIGNEKHKQLTFRLPWNWVDELEAWAHKLGISKEEMKRYLVRRGLDALRDGEKPKIEAKAVRHAVVYD